ncbi:phage tail protein [Vibrio harveyi]|uniref:phage tail-collar fiber domain-containing protein n=1 Tax=Vibrio harveyi TaxID=669 RepID=UPI003CECF54E
MADNKYYAVLTDLGADLIEKAYNAGAKLELVSMGFGDSNGSYAEPDATFTSLVNEFGRNDLNEGTGTDLFINVKSWAGADFAGNTVMEIGIYDADGNLIVYGSYPPSEIVAIDDPEYTQIEIEVHVNLEHASSVTITVNPYYPYATEKTPGIATIITEEEVKGSDDDKGILTIYKLLKRVASESLSGLVRFATAPEAVAGTIKDAAMNPAVTLALIKNRISSSLSGDRDDYALSESAGKALKEGLDGAVPNTRKVNGHALSADISLNAADVGALPDSTSIPDTSNLVPNTRKVNGHALSADISLNAADVGALPDSTSIPDTSNLVPNTRKVNGHALSADISLNAADVGALPDSTSIPDTSNLVPNTRKVNGHALSADISLNAADVGALPDSTSIPDINLDNVGKSVSASAELQQPYSPDLVPVFWADIRDPHSLLTYDSLGGHFTTKIAGYYYVDMTVYRKAQGSAAYLKGQLLLDSEVINIDSYTDDYASSPIRGIAYIYLDAEVKIQFKVQGGAPVPGSPGSAVIRYDRPKTI